MRFELWKPAAIAVLLLAGMGMALPDANATRFLKKNLEQLVAESAVIVIGTVTGISYEADPKEGVPFTKVRLQRLEAIKGARHVENAQMGLTIWFEGGLANDGAMEQIDGMPQLRLGETYLLFLRGGEWTINPISGWSQGAFRLVPGPTRNSQLVLTLDDSVVMGVRDKVLDLGPVRYDELIDKPQASQTSQRGEVKLSFQAIRTDAALPPKESLYREDNVQALEAQDRAAPPPPGGGAEPAVRPENRQDRRSEREKRMVDRLGGKPIERNAFVAALRQIDKEAASRYPPQPFQAEPRFLPKKMKAQSPPEKSSKASEEAP